MKNILFEYLEGVFTTDFGTNNKYVDVESNDEVKEVVETMGGLGESLENKGFQKGENERNFIIAQNLLKGVSSVEFVVKNAGIPENIVLKAQERLQQ